MLVLQACQTLLQGPPEQQLVLPLLVLICQQRNSAEIMENAKDIKFISEQYDMSQQAFQQVPFHLRPFCSFPFETNSCIFVGSAPSKLGHIIMPIACKELTNVIRQND